MSNQQPQWNQDMEVAKTKGMVALSVTHHSGALMTISGRWCTLKDDWVDQSGDYLYLTPYAWMPLPDPYPFAPSSVSPATKFISATPEQFRAFFEEEGWKVTVDGPRWYANKVTNYEITVQVQRILDQGYINIQNCGLAEDKWFEFFKPFATTFGGALRLANNLVEAKLVGGWKE